MKNAMILAALIGGSSINGGTVRAATFSSPQDAFAYLHKVATNPRCTNCHGIITAEGAHIPTVGDQRKPHPMNVNSTLPNLGANCTTCHQRSNLVAAGTPPGAANNLMPGFLWHMPDKSMLIKPDETPRELCEQWLDRSRNGKEVNRGGREDMATFKKEFLHHMEADPLVHWTFAPGPGRTPAPGSKEMLIEAMRTWVEAGAPCP